MKMNDITIIKDFYDQFVEGEWKRLSGFSFEFEITKAKMKEYIKPNTSILDIGGGPGRYSLHFASLGHEVTLVDLSTGNVEFAKREASNCNLEIKAYQADARNLSCLPLTTYDYIFIMGPLYHLGSLEDRQQVINEAKKHLKPGGLMFVSFIQLFAGLNYFLSECPQDITLETELDYFDVIKEDKSWYGNAFTKAYFIHINEIIPLMASCGLEKVTMFGQEGIVASNLVAITNLDEVTRKRWFEISMDLCEKIEYMSHSSHIMYIGKVE